MYNMKKLWLTVVTLVSPLLLTFVVTNSNLIRPILPSVLWQCWLGSRKDIQTVKNMGDSGGVHWLVRIEWRPAGWSVCLCVCLCVCVTAISLWMSVCMTCLLTERQPGSAPCRHDRLRRHCQSSDCCRLKYWCPRQGNAQRTCSVLGQIMVLHSEYQEHHIKNTHTGCCWLASFLLVSCG